MKAVCSLACWRVQEPTLQRSKTSFHGILQLLFCPLELFVFLGKTTGSSQGFFVFLFFWVVVVGGGYCYSTAHNHRHNLLIHLLFPTRGVPKLCWETANPLRCEHICRGTLVEDRCQPAPALQATGDQQQPAFHQGSPYREQALQAQQTVSETAKNSPAEAEVGGTRTRGKNIYTAAC